MGKKNAGAWMDKQRAGAPSGSVPTPAVLGYQRLAAPDSRGYYAVGELLCPRCARGRGVDVLATSRPPFGDAAPGWVPVSPDDIEPYWDACAGCGEELGNLLPLCSPSCGHTGCFETLALAITHVGPDWTPHGTPDLAERWDEELPDDWVRCPGCQFTGEHADFLPGRAARDAWSDGEDDA